MAQLARLPVGLRRRVYRLAYALLCVYWFVRRPECHGVKCVITDGELVLFVRHTYGPPTWDLPGGAIKSGEPPELAAQREMHEELGVEISGWTALGEVAGHVRSRNDILHCFAAELHEPRLTLDLGEIDSARWFPLDALPPDAGIYVRPVLNRLPPGATA